MIERNEASRSKGKFQRNRRDRRQRSREPSIETVTSEDITESMPDDYSEEPPTNHNMVKKGLNRRYKPQTEKAKGGKAGSIMNREPRPFDNILDKKRKYENEKRRKREEELKECSFQPNLSSSRSRLEWYDADRTIEDLFEWHRQKHRKLREMQAKKLADEEMELKETMRHHPDSSMVLNRTGYQGRGSQSRTRKEQEIHQNKLLGYGEQRRSKRELEVNKQIQGMFKPKINANSRKLAKLRKSRENLLVHEVKKEIKNQDNKNHRGYRSRRNFGRSKSKETLRRFSKSKDKNRRASKSKSRERIEGLTFKRSGSKDALRNKLEGDLEEILRARAKGRRPSKQEFKTTKVEKGKDYTVFYRSAVDEKKTTKKPRTEKKGRRPAGLRKTRSKASLGSVSRRSSRSRGGKSTRKGDRNETTISDFLKSRKTKKGLVKTARAVRAIRDDSRDFGKKRTRSKDRMMNTSRDQERSRTRYGHFL